MNEIELIKRLKNQDDFIDLLRIKVKALETVLKNQVPNFEEQYARNLIFFEQEQNKAIKNVSDRHNEQ